MTTLRSIANGCLALSAVLAIVLVVMDEAASSGSTAGTATGIEQTCATAPAAQRTQV